MGDKFPSMHKTRPCIIILLFLGMSWALFSCATPSKKSSPKFEQYFIQGQQLYLTHCSNCHQATGKGLGLLYPPLDSSDYMQQNIEDVLCLIRNGKEGELVVNGKSYNQKMPGNLILTDLEIAEIATYIYNAWDNKQGLLDVKFTSRILESCDSVTAH